MARKTKTELLTSPVPPDELVTVPRAALLALLEAAHWPFIWSRIPRGMGRAKTMVRTTERLKELKTRLGLAEVAAHPFPLDPTRFLESLAQQEAQGSPAMNPPKTVQVCRLAS